MTYEELQAEQWEWASQRFGGKRPGCDWQSNPFVWAVTFRRCG